MERFAPLPPLSTLEPSPFKSHPGQRREERAPWWRLRIPWTVHRYIVFEVFLIFLLGVLAVSLLYTVLAAYQTVRSGLQLNFVWPLLIKTFAYPLYFTVPIAFLFAITLALGRLVSDLEITALRTHGISYLQIYAPVLALGVALTALSYYLNGWIIPGVHFERRNIQQYILKQLQGLGSGVNRTILLPDGEGSLWVGKYMGSQLERVRVDLVTDKESSLAPQLREHLPNKLPSRVTILAREGNLEILEEKKLVLLKVSSVEVLVPEPVRAATIANEIFHQKFAISGDVVIPLSFDQKSPANKDRINPELSAHLARLRAEANGLPAEGEAGLVFASLSSASESLAALRQGTQRKIAAAATEVHRRLAFTLSCLTFAFIGVSLSLLLNRWNRLVPFFFGSLIVIALYYPLLMVGVSLGERGILPPVAMALPNAALLALGIFLARKVVRQ